MKFRSDINGLRAISVLAVVIYHFSPSSLPGGFAGVDVFFVISGFLMTNIIMTEIEVRRFNYKKFIINRAKRLVPALLALCLVLLVFGWYFLPPIIYRELSIHALASLTFLSNIVYWLQIDYFSPSAHEKWFLHTWSLSVEWQFYILFPIFLLGVVRLASVGAIPKIIIVSTFLSFCSSVFASYYFPDESYYLFIFRSWEMLLGGILYFHSCKGQKETRLILFYFGLAFLFISFFCVNSSFLWPGFFTIFPTFGAALIIWSRIDSSFLLDFFAVQKIGNWSYSIYLWHWPIVVYFNFRQDTSIVNFAFGIMLSILLGALSYYLVEKKGEVVKRNFPSGVGDFVTTAVYVSVMLFALIVYFQHGFSSRSDMDERYSLDAMVMPTRSNGYCFRDFSNAAYPVNESIICTLGDNKSTSSILLFGDSFAGQYEPFIEDLAFALQMPIDSLTTNWCFPSFSSNFTGPSNHASYHGCLENREFLKSNIDNYDTIIISGMWLNIIKSSYLGEVMDFIDFLVANGKKVVVLPSPTIYSTNVKRRFLANLFNGFFPFDVSRYYSIDDVVVQDFHDKMRLLGESNKNVYFIERNFLFNEDGLFYLNGVRYPYALDSAHISLLGSRQIMSVFESSGGFHDLVYFLAKS